MPNPEDALMLAAKECDVHRVREDDGPNRDKAGRIAMYLESAGVHVPAPWCAALATWCLVQSGYPRKSLPNHPASTCAWQRWAESQGISSDDPSRARRGDLFVWCDAKKWAGHMGFIVEARKILGVWWVRTVEGNSAEDGSREGAKIVRRGSQTRPAPIGWRRWTSKMRVIRMTAWTP